MKPHSIILAREPITNTIFHTCQYDILYAAYHLNRNFSMRDATSINEFLAFLDIPYIEKAEFFGWDYDYIITVNECVFIDIFTSDTPDEKGVYDIIYSPSPKHFPNLLRGIRDDIDNYIRYWDKDRLIFNGNHS